MKNSLYNSIIPIDKGRSVCYNAMSDTFLIVKSESETVDFNSILEENSDVSEKMKKNGFLIEDEIDEVEELKKIVEEVDNNPAIFHLHINPTVDCNFRCWYCYEDHSEKGIMDTDTIEKVKKLIDRIVSEGALKMFHLSFFGGEPLLGFDECVIPILEYAKEICEKRGIEKSVMFTSNGFLLNREMIEVLKTYSPSFQITLDGGKEDHDKTRFAKGGIPSFDKIISNIKSLAENGIQTICRVNYTAANISSASEIVNEFLDMPMEHRANLQFDYQQVWQDRKVSGRGEDAENRVDSQVREALTRLKEEGFGVSFHRPMSSARSSCYGDKRNNLLVNFNGDVFCCTARDFKSERRDGYLDENGDVIWINDALNHRMQSKFVKKVCHTCRIAPLCAGGCRQQAVEKFGSEQCIYNYTESDKDEIILNRFDNQFV